MNRKQKSFYVMELALRDFLDQNATITSTLPNFGSFFTAFSENIRKIQIFTEQQETDKSGFAWQKSQLRNDLSARALEVCRKTATFAKLTHNAVLAREVHYSETDIKRSTDSMLKDRAWVILEKAEMNLAELAAYGITAEMLTGLKAALEQFISAIPQPRMGIIEKKHATDQLALLFEVNDELLDDMDALAEIIRYSHPEFFQKYWDHRKIIETGRGSLSLKAAITDSVTHTGIKGVKGSFVPQNGQMKMASAKPGKPMVKTTTGKGNFRIKNMAAGTYTVAFEKPGYKEQVVSVNVTGRETTELIVELERI
jgi:hypothetical protein